MEPKLSGEIRFFQKIGFLEPPLKCLPKINGEFDEILWNPNCPEKSCLPKIRYNQEILSVATSIAKTTFNHPISSFNLSFFDIVYFINFAVCRANLNEFLHLVWELGIGVKSQRLQSCLIRNWWQFGWKPRLRVKKL